MNKKRLIQLIPAYWVSIFDIGITIIHQKKEYWNGNLSQANEGNPIGMFFMSHHVLGLFFISFVWLILIGLIGYLLPLRYSKIFLMFVFLAHNFGASSWLASYYGFWYEIAFMFINAIIFYKVESFLENHENKENQSFNRD